MFAEAALFLQPEPYAGAISKRSTRARDERNSRNTKAAHLHQKRGPQPPATAPITKDKE